jgi:hypothetical protein
VGETGQSGKNPQETVHILFLNQIDSKWAEDLSIKRDHELGIMVTSVIPATWEATGRSSFEASLEK